MGVFLSRIHSKIHWREEGRWNGSSDGTENFAMIGSTDRSGSPPEVVPNILVRPNRNGPFYLTPNRIFRNCWHNRKHPRKHPLLKNHHEITGYNLSWHISQGGTGEPGGMGPPGLIGESVGTQSFTKSDTKSNNFSFYIDKNFVPE